MKAAEFELAGVRYTLLFNAAAMFAFDDAFGGAGAYFEQSKGSGSAAFDAICRAGVLLSEQGELARRALGHESAPMLSEQLVRACATPADILRLRQSVISAVIAGFGREVAPEEDVDLGLIELEQKKGKE